jgi:hypothetical protein
MESPGRGAVAGIEPASERTVSQEEIAERAYRIYDQSGRIDGQDFENWLRAESELRAERASASSSKGALSAASAPAPGQKVQGTRG